MQFAASHQAAGDVGSLQRRAFSWRMGRKIACDRYEDVSASISVLPLGELSDSRLQHLICVEACIFA